MSNWQLGQMNIAHALEPLGSERMQDFEKRSPVVNAEAENSPGFIWQLKDTSEKTAFPIIADPLQLVTLSVWQDLESLKTFMYGNQQHVAAMKRRRQWFQKNLEPAYVLWWIEAGHIPDLAEAVERMQQLRFMGPTEKAFTFGKSFGPPE